VAFDCNLSLVLMQFQARDSIPVFSLTEASTEPLGQFQEDIGSQQQEDYEPVPIERLRECDVLIA